MDLQKVCEIARLIAGQVFALVSTDPKDPSDRVWIGDVRRQTQLTIYERSKSGFFLVLAVTGAPVAVITPFGLWRFGSSSSANRFQAEELLTELIKRLQLEKVAHQLTSDYQSDIFAIGQVGDTVLPKAELFDRNVRHDISEEEEGDIYNAFD